MCRLLFDPTPHKSDILEMETQFSALEASAGGDGNGLALLGKHGKLIKGLKPKVNHWDLAEAAVNHDGPILFHTRSASIGGACDELCQPFQVGDSDPIIVAHNGHWTGWRAALELLLYRGKLNTVPMNVSDSWVAAVMAGAFGPGTLKNIISDGVWFYSKYTKKGDKLEVLAINNKGSLCVNMDNGQVASEPVFWGADDNILRICGGSVVSLWPEFKLIEGKLIEWHDGLTKKERRAARRRAEALATSAAQSGSCRQPTPVEGKTVVHALRLIKGGVEPQTSVTPSVFVGGSSTIAAKETEYVEATPITVEDKPSERITAPLQLPPGVTLAEDMS